MKTVYTHIANLGFFIAVSIYLLVQIEGKLEYLNASIHELEKVISTMK